MDAVSIWIHADADLSELRQLTVIEAADIQIDASPEAELIDNTFSVTLPEKVWQAQPVQPGHYLYCPGTEWGGPVTLIRHETGSRTVTLQGPTWRGLLLQKRIVPPEGADYWTAEGVEANALIELALDGGFGGLFAVSTADTGVLLSARWRYDVLGSALQQLLGAHALRLSVIYDNAAKCVRLAALPVADLTSDVEISQDYGVAFTATAGNIESYNHCIALGQGELAERQVLDVYYDGSAFSTVLPAGWTRADLRTTVLDYGNAESEEDLFLAACRHLREYAPARQVTVDETRLRLSAQLGDLVSVRDRLTGLFAVAQITGKILTISGGRVRVDLTTGAGSVGSGPPFSWQSLAAMPWSMVQRFTWGELSGG